MRNECNVCYKKNGHKIGIQKDNVSKIKKRKVHISSLHPSKKYKHFPYQKKSYANSPPKYMTTLNPKLLPFSVTNDKWLVIEKFPCHHCHLNHPQAQCHLR